MFTEILSAIGAIAIYRALPIFLQKKMNSAVAAAINTPPRPYVPDEITRRVAELLAAPEDWKFPDRMRTSVSHLSDSSSLDHYTLDHKTLPVKIWIANGDYGLRLWEPGHEFDGEAKAWLWPKVKRVIEVHEQNLLMAKRTQVLGVLRGETQGKV